MTNTMYHAIKRLEAANRNILEVGKSLAIDGHQDQAVEVEALFLLNQDHINRFKENA